MGSGRANCGLVAVFMDLWMGLFLGVSHWDFQRRSGRLACAVRAGGAIGLARGGPHWGGFAAGDRARGGAALVAGRRMLPLIGGLDVGGEVGVNDARGGFLRGFSFRQKALGLEPMLLILPIAAAVFLVKVVSHRGDLIVGNL